MVSAPVIIQEKIRNAPVVTTGKMINAIVVYMLNWRINPNGKGTVC